MAYNSAHTGPEIDAAVQLLGQIQDARDSTSQDLGNVKELAAQVKLDANTVSENAGSVTAKAAQVAQDAVAVERARQEVVSAAAAADEARDEASLSADSAKESQSAASTSEQAAASSQLAAGLSEQVSAESASEAKAAAEQVAADRDAAAASAAHAAASARDAEAVVTGGTASVVPAPGLIPIANGEGKIDPEWLSESIARTESVQAAADAARQAVDLAAEAQARSARLLGPSPEAPELRDDGTPLQIGDRYLNSVSQAEFIFRASGWAANESLQAIDELKSEISVDAAAGDIPRADETGSLRESWIPAAFIKAAALAAATGATLVSYAHVYTGAVKRSIADIFKTKVDALDFGVVVGEVSYAQAEQNLIALNRAGAYAESVGAGLVTLPAGVIGIRRLGGNDGTNLADSSLMWYPNVTFKGAGKRLTIIKRMGPTTCIGSPKTRNVMNPGLRDLTVDGNPGITGYTKYQANLLYFENADKGIIDNVILKDVPGLHAIDVNGMENLEVTRTDFLGYDISLRGSDTTYYPESVQIGFNPDATKQSKNIRFRLCTVGPSESYGAPLAFIGNHTGGGGGVDHAVEGLVVEDVVANGIVKFLFRLKAWKNVRVSRVRLESGAARFAYLDYKPAYAATETSAATPAAACEEVLLEDCYHNGDGEFLYTDVMSTTADPGTRHRNINVLGGEVVGRIAVNAITLYHTVGYSIRRLKVRGARRAVAAYWSALATITDNDFDGSEVNGIEITDLTGYANGLGYSKELVIARNKVTNTKGYPLYIGATNGYLIEDTDVTGGASATGAQSAAQIFAGCSNGTIRNLYSRDNGNANAPNVGVNITSGSNHKLLDIDLFCTGEMVVNGGTGDSYEVRRITWGTAPPASGAYRQGDVRYNSAVGTGKPKGWYCTAGSKTSGGTWVSMGNA